MSDVPVADLVLRSAKVATFAARQPTADPFECAEDDLCDLRSDLTVVGGRVTHTSGDLEGLRSSLAPDIGFHALASGKPEGHEAGPACPSWCPRSSAIRSPRHLRQPWPGSGLSLYVVKRPRGCPATGRRLR